MKEVIKKIGLKNYIVYYFLRYLEILVNSPYVLLKSIVHLVYCMFDSLDDIFYKDRIIKLSKMSKRIDNFRKRIIEEVKEKE